MNDDNFPLCPVYNEEVLPDENDNCSLCGKHSASKLNEDKTGYLSN